MSEREYLTWPVRIEWAWRWGAWRTWFQWHGCEIGSRYCAWTYHLGPIKVMFGYQLERYVRTSFEHGLHTGLKIEGFARDWMLKEREVPNEK